MSATGYVYIGVKASTAHLGPSLDPARREIKRFASESSRALSGVHSGGIAGTAKGLKSLLRVGGAGEIGGMAGDVAHLASGFAMFGPAAIAVAAVAAGVGVLNHEWDRQSKLLDEIGEKMKTAMGDPEKLKELQSYLGVSDKQFSRLKEVEQLKEQAHRADIRDQASSSSVEKQALATTMRQGLRKKFGSTLGNSIASIAEFSRIKDAAISAKYNLGYRAKKPEKEAEKSIPMPEWKADKMRFGGLGDVLNNPGNVRGAAGTFTAARQAIMGTMSDPYLAAQQREIAIQIEMRKHLEQINAKTEALPAAGLN